MHVDAYLSVKSKRGRELARETAEAILNEVGSCESAFQLIAKANSGEPNSVSDSPNSGNGD